MNVDELVSSVKNCLHTIDDASVCENCTYDEAEEHFDFNKMPQAYFSEWRVEFNNGVQGCFRSGCFDGWEA